MLLWFPHSLIFGFSYSEILDQTCYTCVQRLSHSCLVKVTLEAEVTNKGALALYGRLGFVRAKRLFRYYLNGVDAFRLKLLFPSPVLQSSLSMLTDSDSGHWHNDHIPIEECSEVHWDISFQEFLASYVFSHPYFYCIGESLIRLY